MVPQLFSVLLTCLSINTYVVYSCYHILFSKKIAHQLQCYLSYIWSLFNIFWITFINTIYFEHWRYPLILFGHCINVFVLTRLGKYFYLPSGPSPLLSSKVLSSNLPFSSHVLFYVTGPLPLISYMLCKVADPLFLDLLNIAALSKICTTFILYGLYGLYYISHILTKTWNTSDACSQVHHDITCFPHRWLLPWPNISNSSPHLLKGLLYRPTDVLNG